MELQLADAWRVLDYDPKTGVFTRKVRLAQRHQAGDRADVTINRGEMAGYRRVSIFSKRYLAHRLAIFMITGSWPDGPIDHINGDKQFNALENLRVVCGRVNAENRRKAYASNKLGLLGVVEFKPGVYRARITARGKSKHIGLFATPEEAFQAYVKAKRQLHEGCTI